ncbi:MAG: hypothetical protein CSA70_06670 [Rhodobacterales bacterium]|nr:MAG: hypothetical protein CSA70_06670 [Rhodobacterales bacterium]
MPGVFVFKGAFKESGKGSGHFETSFPSQVQPDPLGQVEQHRRMIRVQPAEAAPQGESKQGQSENENNQSSHRAVSSINWN